MNTAPDGTVLVAPNVYAMRSGVSTGSAATLKPPRGGLSGANRHHSIANVIVITHAGRVHRVEIAASRTAMGAPDPSDQKFSQALFLADALPRGLACV
jgi:hypothetical protein